jgi:hypothetical protein
MTASKALLDAGIEAKHGVAQGSDVIESHEVSVARHEMHDAERRCSAEDQEGDQSTEPHEVSNRRLDVRLSIVDRISFEWKRTAVFDKLRQLSIRFNDHYAMRRKIRVVL